MRQIPGNLLSNAVKFTQHGHVSSLVRAVADELHFRVEDTGIGMTEQQLARVFDEFVQADVSVTRRFGGTGLGMPIVRELTQSLGGIVPVTPEFGVGTVVDLRLPLWFVQGTKQHCVPLPACLPTGPAPEIVAQLGASAANVPVPSDQTAPLPVLVAEDNQVNQKVMIALTCNLDVDLTIVDHGDRALEVARSESYELCLFDAMMPEMDGFTALRRIMDERASSARSMPRAVVVTANVAPDQIAEYHSAGFPDVIEKPISKARLLDCLVTLGLFANPSQQWAVAASEHPSRPCAQTETMTVTSRRNFRNAKVLTGRDSTPIYRSLSLAISEC